METGAATENWPEDTQGSQEITYQLSGPTAERAAKIQQTNLDTQNPQIRHWKWKKLLDSGIWCGKIDKNRQLLTQQIDDNEKYEYKPTIKLCRNEEY